MKEQTALKKVADMARLADSYVSAWGDEAKVSEETLRRLLTSLATILAAMRSYWLLLNENIKKTY